MLEFDLNKTPPTVEQIDIERERLTAQIAKRRKPIRFLMVVLVLIPISLVLLTIMNSSRTPDFALGFLFEIKTRSIWNFGLGWSLFGIVDMILLGIVIYTLGSRLLAFKAQLADLRPLSEKAIDRSQRIIALCCKTPLCEAYRQAVVRQGRNMTNREANMIETWGEGETCRKLHSTKSFCQTT